MAPAATSVAECSSAETGVGPAMARISQSCRGTWADLPMAASNNSSPAAVEALPPASREAAISLVPDDPMSMNIAT